jgi:hypothetical protein
MRVRGSTCAARPAGFQSTRWVCRPRTRSFSWHAYARPSRHPSVRAVHQSELIALLESRAPWSRRRPLAAACYDGLWEGDE